MTARPLQFDETTGSWDTYKVRLEAYFEGHSTEEPKRRALLVAALSDNVVKVLLGRCHPKKVNELSYEDVVKHLEEYYAPQVNEIAASYNFFMRNQEDGESVQAFVTEARRLAEDCNFGEMLHRMTRDRLVCGLRDDDVRRHLLTRRTLTLEEAEDFAIASEKAAESSRRMKKQEASVEEGAYLVQSGRYPKNRPKPGNKTGDSAVMSSTCQKTAHTGGLLASSVETADISPGPAGVPRRNLATCTRLTHWTRITLPNWRSRIRWLRWWRTSHQAPVQ